ncbi:unnamed protein product [Kluyveromyces dobzhanskii CBS 2104]|uniref:WGS project CCBQ000000000 data, contig 00106 n=1 Tax=Kluyveromyces dobzhanskii CBS 2104 TaxID=1427455 RepID=A0A0A8L7T5_9SACH|nr:unnamed protein product [Kluyveromyces dobzhanskii CBS 2104]
MQSVDHERVAEHQRGICLFGYPIFSEKFLFPGVDPSRFLALIGNDQDGFKALPVMYTHGNRGNFNRKNLQKMIPVPLDESTTEDEMNAPNGLDNHRPGTREEDNWYVIMDNAHADVDDQGWMYSWSFRSKHWKGKSGFVRKRVWIRLPPTTSELVRLDEQHSRAKRADVSHLDTRSDSSSEEDWRDAADELNFVLRELKSCKLDRERFQFLETAFQTLSKKDLEMLAKPKTLFAVLETFQFNTSKEKFHKDLMSRLSS